MWLNRFAQLNRGSLPELSSFPVMFVLRLTSDLEGKGGGSQRSAPHVRVSSFVSSLILE